MLSFFRNFTKSRTGLIVIFMVLGVIALAFILTPGVAGLDTIKLGGANNKVLVKIGDQTITDVELKNELDKELRAENEQGRPATMAQLIQAGGVDAVLKDLIERKALTAFAAKYGMVASKKLVDGTIASIPSFQGADGKFNQKTYESVIADKRLTDKDVHDMIGIQKYATWLLNPGLGQVGAINQTPGALVSSYAALQMQRRIGNYAIVRTAGLPAGPAPDDKALQAFYNSNKAKYMIPAQRVIRYATVKYDDVKAASAATDAEIAEAYAKAGARFAATEKRNVRQLVLIDQATANQVAAQVKAGKSIADQAQSLGLSAANFEDLDKAALTQQASPDIANAAFAAPQGGVVGPIRTKLGWAVAQVEKIDKIAAKSLDQVKGDLAVEITTRKAAAAMVARRQKVEDSVGDSLTFDEIIKDSKLTPLKIGPVAADGTNPADANAKPDAALAPVIAAGFKGEAGGDPEVTTLDQMGSFAMVAPEKVIPGTAKPFDSVKAQVLTDYMLNQSIVKARAMASDIVKKINGGMPIQQAMAGVQDPTIQSYNLSLDDLRKGQPSPAVMMTFEMSAKKAKFLQSKDGFIIVYLDQIEEHDASGNPALLTQVRTGLGPLLAQEHAQQFLEAIKRDVKVQRNEAAITAFKTALAGSVNNQ